MYCVVPGTMGGCQLSPSCVVAAGALGGSCALYWLARLYWLGQGWWCISVGVRSTSGLETPCTSNASWQLNRLAVCRLSTTAAVLMNWFVDMLPCGSTTVGVCSRRMPLLMSVLHQLHFVFGRVGLRTDWIAHHRTMCMLQEHFLPG